MRADQQTELARVLAWVQATALPLADATDARALLAAASLRPLLAEPEALAPAAAARPDDLSTIPGHVAVRGVYEPCKAGTAAVLARAVLADGSAPWQGTWPTSAAARKAIARLVLWLRRVDARALAQRVERIAVQTSGTATVRRKRPR